MHKITFGSQIRYFIMLILTLIAFFSWENSKATDTAFLYNTDNEKFNCWDSNSHSYKSSLYPFYAYSNFTYAGATLELDSNGQVTITGSDLDSGIFTGLGLGAITSYVFSQANFDCSNVGTNPITVTVTDILGNSETIDLDVTVKDEMPPVAITQPFTAYLNNSGQAIIIPQDVDGGSTDNCGITLWTLSTSAFDDTNLGENIVTLTVTDANANVASANATVTVEDNTDPVARAKDITVQLDANGDATIQAEDIDNNSTDNSGELSYSIDISDFNCSNIGPNTVTLTVTDPSGNTDSDQATVTVEDSVAPVALAQPITVQLDSSGNASITAAQIDNGSNDACGIASLSLDKTTFDCTNIGANTVTLTVTDNNANVSTAAATVTIEDNVAPIASAQPITVHLDSSGKITITAAQIDNGSNDACGIASLSLDKTTFDCTNVGNNTVTLTVTDNNANVSTATTTVTIEDNVAPIASAQPITAQLDASGNVTITAAQLDNVSNDACGIASLSLDKTTFDCTSVGPNTVTLTVTDNNGNVSSASATVTVEDNVKPNVITQPITVYLDENGLASITEDAVDNGSSDACGPLSFDTSITNFDCNNLGNNSVELTVTDSNGNSDTKSANITVLDTNIPVITPNAPISRGNDAGTCVGTITINNPAVSDNCSVGSITGTRNDGLTLNDPYPIGPTTITWNATDSSGNSAMPVTQEITVTDTEAPVPPTLNNITWGCEYTVPTPEAVDNCDGIILGVPNPNPPTFSSSGTVTWTFTDNNGNSSTATQTITINQLELDITVTPVDCNGSNSGSATGTASGGVLPYTYTWSTLGTGANKANLSAGTYYVTVTDDNGCEITNEVVISEPDALAISGTTNIAVTCYGGNDGSISAGAVTGGTAPYEYSLDNNNFQSSVDFTGLTEGDYTIFIVDANGCALQDNISVAEPEELEADISKINVACFGDSTGSINISNPEGGHGAYEYSMDNSTWQSATGFTGLAAGTYSIYMRDADYNSCSLLLDSNIVISEPSAPISATATSTRTTSYGSSTGSATVNATGGTPPYNYEWSLESDPTFNKNTKTVNNLAAGNYSVNVIDANGCELEEITTVTVRNALTAEIESATLCTGDNVEEDQVRTAYFRLADYTALGGFGNYEYTWDFGSGITPGTGPGQHTVDYETSGNKTITITITDRDENGNLFQTITLTHQQYVGKCHEPCGQAQNAQFDVNSIYIGYLNGDSMENNSEDLCDPAINKYLFLPVSKNVNMYNPYTEITFKTSNGVTEEYETQTDHAGIGQCKDEDEIDEIPPEDNNNKINKVGDWIRLTVDPIQYDCGDALEIEGFYITYTNNSKKDCYSNNNGFCYSINEPVTVPTPVYVEATPTDLLCMGVPTGIITARGSGGFAPYFYNITGPNDAYDGNNNFYGLSAGVYNVYIIDSKGNKNFTTVTISEPSSEISVTVSKNDPGCFGELGNATTTASGGTPFTGNTYEYLWNDPAEQTTATAIDLAAGTYTVTVTDANGCQEIESVTIVEPVDLTDPVAGEDQVLGCGIFETTLDANTPVEGIGQWSIDTANSATGGSFTNLNDPNSGFTGNTGTYTLNWTIANADGSCDDFDPVTIEFVGDCNALDFDGVDDYISMDNNYGFTSGAFTLEIWVKPESTSGIRTILSKKDNSNPSVGGYDLIINNGAPTFRWRNKVATTSKKLTTSRWYHLAVVFQNSTTRLYVDGIEVGNISGASNPATTDAPFLLGAIYDAATPFNPKKYFSGWMEEFRIWNKALIPEQIRFMMNQRLDLISSPSATTPIDGELIQHRNTGSYHQDTQNYNLDENDKRWYDLKWGDLLGYYRLISNDPDPIENLISHDVSLKPSSGFTPDLALSKVAGKLINIETEQENTAPLPYISNQDGSWRDNSTWLRPTVWNVPNGKGINDNFINWNIVEVNDSIYSTAQDIQVLGLISKSGELLINGDVDAETGQGLTVTHYLKLDGSINLEGNSQLVQTEGSILDEDSAGYIDIDQQGTANSFNYNYWSSPVSLINSTTNNTGFRIADVLKDGTIDIPRNIDFNYQYHWADGNYSGDTRISTYWLYTFGDPDGNFNGDADDYFAWHQFDETDILPPGIGFTMKGTTGYVPIGNKQNYTFRGKPNNGDISVYVAEDQNLLTGNPYPSAIDALQFIDDNLNGFNGALYFWDHFGKEDTHYLEEYVGGYAVYNKSGGISSATSVDSRINNNDASSTKEPPGQYIPVGQAFFINTLGVDNPITITYKNEYRAFVKESDKDSNGNDVSQFHMQEDEKPEKDQVKVKLDSRFKIRLKFQSPKGYHRQILVTADGNSTGGFDLGYDAPLIENNVEDMYWMIGDTEFVIQAVPDFNLNRTLPLGIKISETGDYTIKIDQLENFKTKVDIYLWDKINDEYFKISEEDYTATAEEIGHFNDRYEIVFKAPEDEKPEVIEKPEPLYEDVVLGLQYYKDTDEIALSNPDLLKIDKVEIYSISGQKIISFNDVPTERSVLLRIRQQLSSAVYVVKLHSGERIYSEKVIITK
jgi:large repetitive protein